MGEAQPTRDVKREPVLPQRPYLWLDFLKSIAVLIIFARCCLMAVPPDAAFVLGKTRKAGCKRATAAPVVLKLALHAKLWLRALRVCSCTSKRPPGCIEATPNARRVGCHVCLELPLLYINSSILITVLLRYSRTGVLSRARPLAPAPL